MKLIVPYGSRIFDHAKGRELAQKQIPEETSRSSEGCAGRQKHRKTRVRLKELVPENKTQTCVFLQVE